jgi:Inner membrane protein YgaP-like, transmembrane domain
MLHTQVLEHPRALVSRSRRAHCNESSTEVSVMTRNEGMVDRVLRIVLGLALLSLIFVGPKTWLGLIGLVPLATGLVGFCPLYRVVGVRTCAAHS